MAGADCQWQIRILHGGYGLLMCGTGLVVGQCVSGCCVVAGLTGHCWVVGRCGSGCWVITGLAGCCWVIVGCYSSLGCTIGIGYGRGGGYAVVVVVPIVVVSTVVAVAVFFLVATCRFKDAGWVNLFEAGKMRENGLCHMLWPVSVTHRPGIPFPGSPLVFFIPQILH